MATQVTRLTADVIIIGGGFSGCLALHKMRQLGLSAKILEAQSDFGGVWQQNRYPGCRVDSETPLYQLSLPEVYDGFNFSSRFPDAAELRRYFTHVDSVLGLRSDTIFDARVCDVRFGRTAEGDKKWTVRTENDKVVASSTYIILAVGTTNKAYTPDIAGLKDTFRGLVVHSSAWPEQGINLRGKRVGILGQGATGIQIVQELAEHSDVELTVLVRTPATLFPMRQHDMAEVASEASKSVYNCLFHNAKYINQAGFAYNGTTASWAAATESQRQAVYEREWRRGGFGCLTSTFWEVQMLEDANAHLYDFWRTKVRARMAGHEAKADIVAPAVRPKFVGSHRPNLEQHYFESLCRPNVKLVDLKATPIERFSAGGVHLGGHNAGGQAQGQTCHELDVLICATGFDGVTGSLLDLGVHDRLGVPLRDKWATEQGISTYLGMMVPALPNAFMLFGPQAPTSFTNAPPFIELQVEWITELIKKARDQDKDEPLVLEPTPEAAAEWKALVMAAYTGGRFERNDSWWVGSNIPGKKREPLSFAGGIRAWWERCQAGLTDWSNFVTSKSTT